MREVVEVVDSGAADKSDPKGTTDERKKDIKGEAKPREHTQC